jgi:hypothetical protein
MMAGVKSAPGKSRPAKSKKTAKKARPVAKAKAAAKAKPVAKAKAKPAAKAVAKTAKKAAPAKMFGKRADLGAPIDGFFAKQPPALRPVTLALRALIEEVAPDATASIKWGMPFFSIGTGMMCAIGAHKAHVNLILSGPPDAFDDPEQRLEGEGKTGKHLKVTTVDELPRDAIRGWLRTARELAIAK